METIKSCKLYDYDKQQWLDFKGQPTSPALKKEPIKREEVAV
jgi:omega-6 fatty acid desaturase (delta-12 desaturase)